MLVDSVMWQSWLKRYIRSPGCARHPLAYMASAKPWGGDLSGLELRRAQTREERIEYPAHGYCGSNWRLFVS